MVSKESQEDDWINQQNYDNWQKNFERDGFLVVDGLLNSKEINYYRQLYDDLLSGKIDASSHRHDLGSHVKQKVEKTENICQIMWPSLFVDSLSQRVLHRRAHEIAKNILGDDMAFDFDMLIAKAPHTDTVTPLHQDESYWLDMPDKRAVSVWVALDDACLDNGCMWFGQGSHKLPIREHHPAAEGHHVLYCKGDESELTPAPVKAGSCTLHHGRTLHYTRGNTTDNQRRAFIVNFRPESMVKWERDHDFDHRKAKGLKNLLDDERHLRK